jgi:hypothetical protein
MRYMQNKKIAVALCSIVAALVVSSEASAIVLDLGERVSVGLVTPVENNTGFSVGRSKYYPGDILSLKMEEYMLRQLRGVPRASIETVRGENPSYWAMDSSSLHDLILQVQLEDFNFRKSDLVGSTVRCSVTMRLHVYDSDKRLLYDRIIERRGSRYYPLFNDILDYRPIYWETFEKSPCWPTIKSALDEALKAAIGGYNGYRVVGRIVAKAERVDGSFTVPKKIQDKIYHINLGLQDSVKVGDLLAVTRASSVRTIDPETPEMHFPQVVGRVRVIFVKGRDGVVQLVKESKDAPIQLGDAISAPLYGRRDGSAKF